MLDFIAFRLFRTDRFFNLQGNNDFLKFLVSSFIERWSYHTVTYYYLKQFYMDRHSDRQHVTSLHAVHHEVKRNIIGIEV